MTSAEQPILRLESVQAVREDALTGVKRTTVHDVTLDIRSGERVALVGANGAGKTSLLLALVGATEWDGRISVAGLELGDKTLQQIRRKLGFVFANPADQLFSDSVHAEIAFGPRARGLPDTEVSMRVDRAMDLMGIAELSDQSPNALSLGEQRLVAIASVLACEPDVLLLDEPTASLDGRARRRLLQTLSNLDTACVVATHDLDFALELQMRVVALRDGRVVADGSARDVLTDAELLERAALEPPLSASSTRN